jgi:hypothetical protein
MSTELSKILYYYNIDVHKINFKLIISLTNDIDICIIIILGLIDVVE